MTAPNAPHQKESKYWFKKLNLYKEDQVILNKGRWLNDNIINASQLLLKAAYPLIGGLQNTILAETLAFDVQRGLFVQVLNVSGAHWITVSNVHCETGVVSIYDSIPSGYIPSRTKEQIAAMLFTKAPTITFKFQSVQSQNGSADCGLFSLAFAASLCAGETTCYVQHLMRSHLAKCFEDDWMNLFPTTSRQRKLRLPKNVTILERYCKCRLPEQGQMICCDLCKEWYHKDCVSVPEPVWINPNDFQFVCDLC